MYIICLLVIFEHITGSFILAFLLEELIILLSKYKVLTQWKHSLLTETADSTVSWIFLSCLDEILLIYVPV